MFFYPYSCVPKEVLEEAKREAARTKLENRVKTGYNIDSATWELTHKKKYLRWDELTAPLQQEAIDAYLQNPLAIYPFKLIEAESVLPICNFTK